MPNLAKLLGGVAAIVLVAVLGWRLLPSNGGIGAPAPIPTPSAGPTSTATPSASAASAVTHVAAPFLAPFTISLPAGFTARPITEGEAQFDGGAGFVGVFLVQSVRDDPCHPPEAIASEQPSTPPPSAAQLVSGLTHMTGFDAGAVSTTTMAGLPARQFTVSNTIDTDAAGCAGGSMLPLFTAIGGNAPATNGGTTLRMWVVDTPTGPVLIVVESGPEHQAEVDALLASIHFDP